MLNLRSLWERASPAERVRDRTAQAESLEKIRAIKEAALTEQNVQNAALWDAKIEGLPDFAPNATCVKCGDSGASVSFERPVFAAHEIGLISLYSYMPSYYGVASVARHALLRHKCSHCSYSWETKTADHPTLSPQAQAETVSSREDKQP